MKFRSLLFWLVGVALGCTAAAQTQNLDRELSQLAEKLAAQVKESGRKMVTVLDFTDLQGNSSELGRFVAEELSVSLVERRSGFTVIDRANLKVLLAEQKLTEEGLVDPKKAQEFKKASGVDAIILGKLTVLKDDVALAAKILATDSAETLGAARARLPMSKEIEQLLAAGNPAPRPAGEKLGARKAEDGEKTGAGADLAGLLEVRKNSATVNQFFVKVESLRETRQGNSSYGTVTVAIVNQGDKAAWVRVDRDGGHYSSLTNQVGTVFETDRQNEVSGILAGDGNYTDIPPKQSILVTFRHMVGYQQSDPTRRPCRFEFVLRSAINTDGGPNKGEIKNNVLIDIQ